jgi:glycosyltransferase involved in cell wall biosynthesis
LKILHVIPSFAPAWRYGGPIFAVDEMTRELARHGHRVTVMTTNIDGPGVLEVPTDRPVDRAGVEVWYFPVERPRGWCYSRALGRALRERVAEFEVVHIHSMFLWPTFAAARWCRRHGVPYIVRPAGSLDPICYTKPYESWWNARKSRWMKSAYLRTLGRADLAGASALHFTSEAEREAVRPLNLGPPACVVPLGVSPLEAGTNDLRARYPQFAGKKILLFLSRLDPKKGFDVLLPALRELSARRNDFVFVVGGAGEPGYGKRLESQVRALGLESITVFLGAVYGAEKWALLRAADLFVLPSYQENFGIAAVEALAAGVPVVLSDRVNVCREVEQASAGLVIPPEPVALADALEALLADPQRSRQMGARGAALARERFSWPSVVQATVEMYFDVLRRADGFARTRRAEQPVRPAAL